MYYPSLKKENVLHKNNGVNSIDYSETDNSCNIRETLDILTITFKTKVSKQTCSQIRKSCKLRPKDYYLQFRSDILLYHLS